ncbi:MAG: dTDP-4-dehydrorhamnose 3,5-epimerase [Candidatus Marinimicrobia bacterium]|nr:dTDP-4-dehydrorhamnose 3,5-epimerase [Candidatus Neomarinimicrobiota bacterium]
MKIEKTALEDVLIIQTKVFEDDRGFFMEVHRRDEFADAGLNLDFVQDNHSRSRINTLRGLHFQWEPAMGKLMRVTRGQAFLVAIDIRKNSPNLGKWFGLEVSEEDKRQVWAPAGFARGFCALSDVVDIQYKCTGTYNQACESGILWNDPEIGIKWPVAHPLLSAKDARVQTLAQWLEQPESGNFLK